MNKIMKLFAVVAIVLSMVGCAKVDPGNIGIRVSNFGDRGVQGELVEPGKFVWNGPGYQLYEFPLAKQNYVYKGGEAIQFGTVEGLTVKADIGVSYRVNKAQATTLFQQYRKGVAEITAVDLRNIVQNAFVNVAGTRKIETVYGSGKKDLIDEVKKIVTARVQSSGLVIDDIYWSGNPTLPSQVQDSITNKIRATQMAEQRQNEVAQAEAEANKLRAQAQGEADARLASAKAEAEAIRIKGAALRENQDLVNLTLAEKWDGKYPNTLIIGSDKGQILQIPTGK